VSREVMGRKYPVILAPYDPSWPDLYEAEARHLRSRFAPDLVPRTEHIGSTAVPGMAAKPVIDLLVEVRSFEAAEREVRPSLERDGYTYIWRAEVEPGHIMFVKGYGPDGYLPGVQIYHLHMAPADHPIRERVLFRDYLRGHPEAAREYEDLKRALARLHPNDREAYTEGKTEWIAGIMSLARAARPSSAPSGSG